MLLRGVLVRTALDAVVAEAILGHFAVRTTYEYNVRIDGTMGMLHEHAATRPELRELRIRRC
jgi:hypothetical protein